MTNRSLLYVVGALTFLVVVLAWTAVYFARDEIAALRAASGESKPAERAVTREGTVTVTLSPKAQAASGIATAQLAAHTISSAAQAVGTVIAAQPLVELRTRVLAAENEVHIARVAVERSRGEFTRMQALYRDEQTVSQQTMLAAQATWKSDQAKLAANESALSSTRALLRQEWGDAITAMVLSGSADYQRLARGELVLLQMVLPQELDSAPAQWRVVPAGTSRGSREAKLLSPAMQGDATMPGRTFLYLSDGADLRVGMRVSAQHSAEGTASGVIVPTAAIVWHGGMSWVYVKTGPESFVRRPLETEQAAGEGWFSATLKPGLAVVVRGAQLLLSEEFRYQIKDENDD